MLTNVCYYDILLIMKSKTTIMMRIPVEVHKQMQEIKNCSERSYVWILKRAIDNYYKITVGNRIKIK